MIATDIEKKQLSIEVAKLYYELDYSQQKIANELKISRPTVSRLLKYAKSLGYVTITIAEGVVDTEPLANKLKDIYGLKEVIVTQTPSDNRELITQEIGKSAAAFLDRIVKKGDVIGISWGMTLYEMAKHLSIKKASSVEIVQLKGGVSHTSVNTHAHDILSLFADAYQTEGYSLPLPVIFDNPLVKKMVEEDRHIHRVIEMGKKATIAVFTVGTIREEALLFQLGYLNKEERLNLQKTAVGDICSRFYSNKGELVNLEIDNRTIGIELTELKKKEWSILVAGGLKKVAAIKGALAGGYCNVLVIDYLTAKELLV